MIIRRLQQMVILGIVVAFAGLAHAVYTGPSDKGYSVEVDHFPMRIYLPTTRVDASNTYPSSAIVTVRVRDASGQPVDDVPVDFDVEPGWKNDVVFTPKREMTEDGVARAVIAAKNKTGFVNVIVEVDGLTSKVAFNIMKRSPAAGGPVFRQQSRYQPQ